MVRREVNHTYISATFLIPEYLLVLFLLLATVDEWAHVQRFGVCLKHVENAVVKICT
jgi:hypothetical protein